MKKIDIITLGCAKNIVDSEHIGAAVERGYEVVFDDEGFDRPDFSAAAVVINTCGFILDAKQESIDTILSAIGARSAGRIERLFVMGCLSELYADSLRAEIPEVDMFFGVNDFSTIVEQLGGEQGVVGRRLTTPTHYAYLKIAEGCNWGCGYCAIPQIRGAHRSVPMEQLLAEAGSLAQKGVKELIVIAQDTTYYGLDLYKKRTLALLLQKLCSIEGIEWIRLQYAYPADFDQEILTVMAREPKICKYIDIPFQHISDNVLSTMRRGLSKVQTEELIVKLRESVPQIAIRTTLLVGYPTETEQDMVELEEFVRWAQFDRLGVFAYSQQEGTYSEQNFADSITDQEKEARVERIMTLQQRISQQKAASRIGQQLRVLFDRIEGDFLVGRSQYDSPEVDGEVLVAMVDTKSAKRKIGKFADVRVTSVDTHDLYGEEV